MDHRGEGRDRLDQLRHRLAVGNVARRDLHLGAQLAQLRLELVHALGLGAAAAHQQQPLRAELARHVTCEDRAEAAGAAGDQHGAVTDLQIALLLRRRSPREPRRVQLAVAQRQLRLVHTQRRGRQLAVHVEQQEPVRVLRLRAPHQTPRRGRVRIRRLAVHGDRAARHECQLRVHEPLVRDPRLQQLERIRRIRDLRDHDLRHLRQLLERTAERRRLWRGSGGLQLDPVEPEQRVAARAPCRPERCRVDRPGRERVHREHRRARLVERREARRAVALPCEPDPQRLRADRVQPHAAPRERQPQLVAAVEERGVQGGVEQRGVHTEPARRLLLLERHLREHLVAVAPRGAQALEQRPVAEAELGQPVVQEVNLERLGALRRPLAGERLGIHVRRCEEAARVAHPGV